MAMAKSIVEVMAKRRSIYDLSAELPLSREAVAALVKEVVLLSPTALNGQETHAVVLFGPAHRRLWTEIVMSALRPQVPPERFGRTEAKLKSIAAGAGTILFFSDSAKIAGFKASFPLYADHFEVWSHENLGILEGNIWNALAEKNIGASLQHYNPLIDDRVKKAWDLPASWRLDAQMVFGGINSVPAPKAKEPIETRVAVFGE